MDYYKSNGQFNTALFKRECPDEYQRIMDKYSPVKTFGSAYELDKNDLPVPRCPTCGKVVGVKKLQSGELKRFCSAKCSAANDSTKAARMATNVEKYGVVNPGMREEQKQHNSAFMSAYRADNPYPAAVAAMSDDERKQYYVDIGIKVSNARGTNNIGFGTLFDEITSLNENLDQKTISERLGMSHSRVGQILRSGGAEPIIHQHPIQKSSMEMELADYFGGSSVRLPSSTPGPGLELDIVVGNVAIEYNGLYWHSDKFKPRSYHKRKQDDAEAAGYRLFQIHEGDDLSVWKSVIDCTLGRNTRVIYGRKTELIRLSAAESKSFVDENHLQRGVGAKYHYGLVSGRELVAVMTFGKARYRSDVDWELIRFCNKKRVRVVGGFSKLLKAFRSDHSGSIVSYANRRWSVGNVYEKNGFVHVHDTEPGYVYLKNNVVYHRSAFMKHRLASLLEVFDESLSESENMRVNGYHRVFDCGNKVYILR